MQGFPIAIHKNNCANCYRCARECEVKAIKFNLEQPEIVPGKCVMCGNCVDICPASVITVESHVSRVRRAIKNNETIIASLGSGWVAEFKDVASVRMIEALKLLGFTHVSETALGASLLQAKVAELIASSDEYFISNICPVTTRLITNYFPSLADRIVNFPTPQAIHASMLKKIYGQDAVIVTIDSCAGSKALADLEENDIFAAITFEELEGWFKSEEISFDLIPGNDSYCFEPMKSTENNLYISPRGVNNHHFLQKHGLSQHAIYDYDGLERCKTILTSLQNEVAPKNAFIELYACKGGCLAGAGCIDKLNLISKRAIVSKYELNESPMDLSQLPSEVENYNHIQTYQEPIVTEEQISDTLDSLFIDPNNDLINCGGCGYRDCYSFAKSIVAGYNDPEMCVHYLKEVAQNRFTTLIDHLHSGIGIVNDKLEIIEANESFARVFGAESLMMYEANPGMTRVSIDKLLPFSEKVSQLLKSGNDMFVEQLQIKNKMLKFVVVTLQPHKSVGIIARSMFSAANKQDEVITQTRKVIDDNLATVQKIAYLLGENASQTEAVLNSIIDYQTLTNVE